MSVVAAGKPGIVSIAKRLKDSAAGADPAKLEAAKPAPQAPEAEKPKDPPAEKPEYPPANARGSAGRCPQRARRSRCGSQGSAAAEAQ